MFYVKDAKRVGFSQPMGHFTIRKEQSMVSGSVKVDSVGGFFQEKEISVI